MQFKDKIMADLSRTSKEKETDPLSQAGAKRARVPVMVGESEQEIQEVSVQPTGFKCSCGQMFTRKFWLETHIRNQHGNNADRLQCDLCEGTFKNKESLSTHRNRVHYNQ